MVGLVTKFLKRPTNIGKVIIGGKRINRRVGHAWFGNSLRARMNFEEIASRATG